MRYYLISLFFSHAADSSDICFNQSPATIPFMDCSDTVCDCPTPPYQCPPDSIIVSTRISACCVLYECVCPNISCPLLMECGQGVQPIPDYRGNGFPGRCCPDYNFEGTVMAILILNHCGHKNHCNIHFRYQ